MSLFTAELQVAGHHYQVVRFELAFTQPVGPRGQVSTKVRHGQLILELDVPVHDHLLGWAAQAHKALAGTLVLLSATGQPQEHIAFTAGYCTHYGEQFLAGDRQHGAYRCHLHIADPGGFTIGPGAAPGNFSAPAAREHGSPPPASTAAAAPAGGRVPNCPPAVFARLRAQIELMCKSENTKCGDEDSCDVLLAKIVAFQQCIAAREAEMNQCYNGGDAGHKQEVQQRRNGIKLCQDRYNRKCLPRKPFEPVPATRPSSDPAPEPEQHNPAIPATGVAVGALILYLLTAALRPGPI